MVVQYSSGDSPLCSLDVTKLENLIFGAWWVTISCARAPIPVRRRVLPSAKTPLIGQPESEGKMRSVLNSLWNVWNDDQGQDIAEYALMLTVILLIVVASLTSIGTSASSIFNSVASQLSAS